MHIDSAISAIKSGDNDEGRKQLLEAEKSLEGVTSAVDAEKRIEAALKILKDGDSNGSISQAEEAKRLAVVDLSKLDSNYSMLNGSENFISSNCDSTPQPEKAILNLDGKAGDTLVPASAAVSVNSNDKSNTTSTTQYSLVYCAEGKRVMNINAELVNRGILYVNPAICLGLEESEFKSEGWVLAGCERLSVQQLAEVVNKIPNYNTIAALTTSILLLTPPGYDDDDDSDPGDEREYVRDEDEEEED
jgi:hypothetical protein